jgi:ATP-grasp domain
VTRYSARCVVLSPRAHDLASIFPVLGVSTLVTCEDGPDVQRLARRTGLRVVSLEAELRHRRRWRSSDLDLLVELSQEVLGGSHVLPYASCAALDEVIPAPRTRYAVASRLKNMLDDKHLVRRLLAGADLPVPPHVELAPGHTGPTFDQIVHTTGVPFVIQPRLGSAGVGTALIGDRDAYRTYLVGADGSHMASRLVGSTTLNVHGVVSTRGTDVYWPTVQLTGIDGFHTDWGGYCGSDATAVRELPADLVAHARTLTAHVGDMLAGLRYRGVFGVDLAVSDQTGEITVLEVNPRFQASTWLLDRGRDRTSIAARHIAAYGRTTVPFEPPGPVDGAFLVINAPERVTIAEEVPCGTYVWSPEDRLRPACGTADGTRLSIFGAPHRGTTVDRGGTIVRVLCTGRTLAARGGRALTPFGSRVFAAASELVLQHCA